MRAIQEEDGDNGKEKDEEQWGGSDEEVGGFLLFPFQSKYLVDCH